MTTREPHKRAIVFEKWGCALDQLGLIRHCGAQLLHVLREGQYGHLRGSRSDLEKRRTFSTPCTTAVGKLINTEQKTLSVHVRFLITHFILIMRIFLWNG